jgi:transmembrane sensor
MDRQTFLGLLDKYLNGTASPVEQGLLEEYYKRLDEKSKLEFSEKEEMALRRAMLENIQFRINGEQEKVVPLRPNRRWIYYAAATSLVAFLSVGGYFLINKKPVPQLVQDQVQDVAPGSNKAILISHGRHISISDAKDGLLAQQGNTTITKTGDGKLVYNTSGKVEGAILYDTLIVPRGGQHQVKFADGSIAYLNADSKLRIPENFEGSNRTVELISGEADFKVVHNAKRPFTVIANGQVTKDIGTEFNINAYPDEPVVKTTLLEGSVEVRKNARSAVLKPGQQASVGQTSNAIKIQDVDTDEIFAWKNGKFLFSSTPLESIMRQVSRWYDVEVVYQNEGLKSKPFSAISTRFANASQVLHSLELTGDVKFKIEGKKITVLNK